MIGCSERGNKDGSFDEAMFSSPQGVVLDGHNLYIADTDNHKLRLVCGLYIYGAFRLSVLVALFFILSEMRVVGPELGALILFMGLNLLCLLDSRKIAGLILCQITSLCL